MWYAAKDGMYTLSYMRISRGGTSFQILYKSWPIRGQDSSSRSDQRITVKMRTVIPTPKRKGSKIRMKKARELNIF